MHGLIATGDHLERLRRTTHPHHTIGGWHSAICRLFQPLPSVGSSSTYGEISRWRNSCLLEIGAKTTDVMVVGKEKHAEENAWQYANISTAEGTRILIAEVVQSFRILLDTQVLLTLWHAQCHSGENCLPFTITWSRNVLFSTKHLATIMQAFENSRLWLTLP